MRRINKELLALGMAFGISFGTVAGAEEPLPSSKPFVPISEPSVAEPKLCVPCMARTPKTKVKLSISKKGRAKLSGKIQKDSAIKRIAGTVSLEKYSPGPKKWRKIKVWKVAKNGSSLSVSYGYQLPKRKRKGVKKRKYRVRVRMLLYKGVGERGMPAADFSRTRKY